MFFNGAPRSGRRAFTVGVAALMASLDLYSRLAPPRLEAFTAWWVYAMLAVATCAVVAKRLHDLSIGGWWSGLAVIAFINVWPKPQGLGWFFLGLLVLGVVWLGLAPGVRGVNRFGPPDDGYGG